MDLTIDNALDEIIQEVGGDTTDSDFKALMFVFLKSGIRHIPAFIRSRLFVTLGTKTLAVGSTTVDLSTLSPGFIKERSVWWVTPEGKRHIIYPSGSSEKFNENYASGASGDPRVYRIYAKTMEFDRGAAVERTIGIEYFNEVSDLETTDTFFGDEPLLEATKYFTKMVYFASEQDMGQKKENQKDGEKIIFEIEGDYEGQEQGGYVESSRTGGLYDMT